MSNNADNKLADAIRAAFHDDHFTVNARDGRVWLGMKFEQPTGKFTKANFSTASTFGFARDDKRKRVTESDMLDWLGQAEGHIRAELPKYNEASAVQARELLGELEAHGSVLYSRAMASTTGHVSLPPAPPTGGTRS